MSTTTKVFGIITTILIAATAYFFVMIPYTFIASITDAEHMQHGIFSLIGILIICVVYFVATSISMAFTALSIRLACPEWASKCDARKQIMKIRKSQRKYLIEKRASGENLTDSEQNDLSQSINRPIDVDEVNRIAKTIPSDLDGVSMLCPKGDDAPKAPKEMMQYIYYVGGFLVVVIVLAYLSM